MAFDIKKVAEFFADHTKPMPEELLSRILSGMHFEYEDLQTKVMEWSWLQEQFAPAIAQKIDAPTRGYNIPIVRRFPTPDHYVYHPISGEYLGTFRVNAREDPRDM
jgi:hypothetical protein